MSKAEYDAIAELLKRSDPRPAPSADQEAAARIALRREWQAVSRRHRARRGLRTLALAASVMLAALVGFQVLKGPVVPAVAVAAIDKTFGIVYVLGEAAELRPVGEPETIMAGQTMVTSHGAGIAIAWGQGGSLRIDEDTRIRFTGTGSAFLEHGRVYFDSVAGPAARSETGGISGFVLETGHGVVTHVGTQYMVEVDDDRLAVSVREGEALLTGRYHEQRVDAGQQATVEGTRRPTVLGISRYGDRWEWVERTTPAADVDGRTLLEFLSWVSRELGLELRFEGGAENIAREAVLRGKVEAMPKDALRLRLETAALDWHIDDGVLYISD